MNPYRKSSPLRLRGGNAHAASTPSAQSGRHGLARSTTLDFSPRCSARCDGSQREPFHHAGL